LRSYAVLPKYERCSDAGQRGSGRKRRTGTRTTRICALPLPDHGNADCTIKSWGIVLRPGGGRKTKSAVKPSYVHVSLAAHPAAQHLGQGTRPTHRGGSGVTCPETAHANAGILADPNVAPRRVAWYRNGAEGVTFRPVTVGRTRRSGPAETLRSRCALRPVPCGRPRIGKGPAPK
jgi:hypothetical protein